MGDNAVHADVINKLWQVYGESWSGRICLALHLTSVVGSEVDECVGTEQEIPKLQRQGAIIILGMLALAKREVVTERVEMLLKIGLGPLGMVRYQLDDAFMNDVELTDG